MSNYDTAFSDKLASALKDAVAEFNCSKDPSKAVAKTAEDYGFGASGTRRLLESFNRARTIYHFETAGDNKEAEFDLAEPDKVFKAMYTPKTAAPVCDSVKAASYMADSYSVPDLDYTIVPEPYVKVAEVVDPTMEQHKHYLKLASVQSGLRRSIDMSCDAIGIELHNFDRCITKVASDIIAESKNVEAIQAKVAAIKEACFREGIEKIAEKLEEKLGPAYINKQAEAPKFPRVMDTRPYQSHLNLMKVAATSLCNFAEATAIKQAMIDELGSINSLILGLARPDEVKVAETGVSSFFSKRAGLYEAGPMKIDVARAASGGANNAFKNVGKELNNVHRQLLLQDIMLTDPVLSKADPNTVLSAYQNVLNLSPEIANQRATVIPILRQSINAPDAFSPYDALQMAKLDRAMKVNSGRAAPPAKEEE